MTQKPRMTVLYGGESPEREVSLASGAQVAEALREAGYPVRALDLPESELPARLGEVRADTDWVFPIYHGGAGEDGTVQALLELAKIPYIGSRPLGCALAMHKEVAKGLFRAAGIPTPDWIGAGSEEADDPALLDRVEAALGLPLIVKPPSGGSTVGLTLAHTREELDAAVPFALKQEPRVLFERYVRGRELTVGVVAGEALPVGEIRPAHEIFDFECKYVPGMAEEIFPAPLPPEVAARAQALALRVCEVLFLRHLARVDFILDAQGELWCLEANALPGMTPNSLLPRAARAHGWSLPELVSRMVEAGEG